MFSLNSKKVVIISLFRTRSQTLCRMIFMVGWVMMMSVQTNVWDISFNMVVFLKGNYGVDGIIFWFSVI